MKKFIVALGVAALAIGATSCNKGGSAEGNAESNDSLWMLLGEAQGAQIHMNWETMPDTLRAKMSKDEFIAGMKAVLSHDVEKERAYLLGIQTAVNMVGNIAQMKDAGIAFDEAKFMTAFATAFKADSIDQAHMNEVGASIQVYMTKVQEKLMQKQQEAAENKAKPNIEAGKAFVDKQKQADPSIKTTEKGVSYKVEKEGTGAKPGKKDRVKVKYVGKHIDGSEFDSSKGEAVEFPVDGVIPGFAEVLQMMAPGAKYIAYIPADQGYGNGGTPNIEPGETLVFEIEMVEVLPSTAKAKEEVKK